MSIKNKLDPEPDASIGATFAAALRDQGVEMQFGEPPPAPEEEPVAYGSQPVRQTLHDPVEEAEAEDEAFDEHFGEFDAGAEGEAHPADAGKLDVGADDFLRRLVGGAPAEDDETERRAFSASAQSVRSYADEVEDDEDAFPHEPVRATAHSTFPPQLDAHFGAAADDDADATTAAPPVDEEAVAQDDAASAAGLGFDYAFDAEAGDRLIPRITVHAFCNRPNLLGVARTITKDRRMRNVAMEVFDGGIPAALAYYVNETLPNLMIVEATGEPRQVLAELDELAHHCDENIRIIVIGTTNDIRFYRELMRRGVSEYLVAPIDPVQLIRSISALFANPDAPFVGKTVAVTGVKGGVGASAIAHNLAWAMSERVKVNATLVDLDLNFGTAGLDFNEEPPATIADALMSPDRFDDAVMGRLITKKSDRLSMFTAPATLDRTFNLDPETYQTVLEQVRATVPFVLLDLPHTWSDWYKATIIDADEIIIVATPDLASLRNGKNLVDFLKAARPNDKGPKLVLNMVSMPKRPEIPAKDFGAAIGVEPTLSILYDAALFGTAANNGQMIFEVGTESKCCTEIDRLAMMLTGREVQVEKKTLLQKLMGTK